MSTYDLNPMQRGTFTDGPLTLSKCLEYTNQNLVAVVGVHELALP